MDLSAHIKGLPQELQDDIFELTLEHLLPGTVIIKNSYKPPMLLQMSRKTRAKFAEKYYSRTTFHVQDPNWDARVFSHQGVTDVTKWIAKMPQTHVDLMKHVKISIPCTTMQVDGLWSELAAASMREEIDQAAVYRTLTRHGPIYATLIVSFEPINCLVAWGNGEACGDLQGGE
ncbi:uncharacterized protein RCC_05447 [Ramularia collo-cygni]|uniref:Uncharacterized protein n=1 Tax=Ramularia collo-cygni TaxID=112498 RepID=A0A2D3V7N5_9PEZI|nr:uncharacterized protein RCC_05447 [Ramularia collo-cygni]CZT19596.1 uncharacterized protein RCC_05447 [Ramularia collo-cygni]